ALLLCLNRADVFYCPYKLQRIDAELLYVLRNPFYNLTTGYFLYFLLTVLSLALFSFITYRWLKKYYYKQMLLPFKAVAFLSLILLFILFWMGGSKKWLPTYPLVDLPY